MNKCHRTIAARIADGLIVPDGVVITGGKQSLVFDVERLPAIREALKPTEVVCG